MAKLISVKGPHTTDPDRPVKIQWSMGNVCNYSCTYCPSILHNGTKPWLSLDQYLTIVDKISAHYVTNQNRFMHWELIGGEITTIPKFEKIIERIHSYNSSCTIYTNGSRTIEWWKEARNYLSGVVITYHPLTMDKQHLFDVVDVLKGYCTIDLNIAGVGGMVTDLGKVADDLRELFKNNAQQSVYDVNITVKTLYKKYLGDNDHQQDSYYQYTDDEMTVLQRPGLLPRPPEPKVEHEEDTDDSMSHPRFWSTEFLYDDGSTKYVQSHQIINEGLNQFKGMKCELGYDSINIDMNGEVISSWCGAKTFGNITQIDEWDLPSVETVCPYDFCNNLNDISITKTC
jgi:organic radical activating enzyme